MMLKFCGTFGYRRNNLLDYQLNLLKLDFFILNVCFKSFYLLKYLVKLGLTLIITKKNLTVGFAKNKTHNTIFKKDI